MRTTPLIGAQIEAIKIAEDRQLFKDAMRSIGLDVPRSSVVKTLQGSTRHREGTPVFRSSSVRRSPGRRRWQGHRHNIEEFKEITQRGLDLSPVH